MLLIYLIFFGSYAQWNFHLVGECLTFCYLFRADNIDYRELDRLDVFLAFFGKSQNLLKRVDAKFRSRYLVVALCVRGVEAY